MINWAINKKDINSGINYNGITEFLAKKTGVSGKEAMLIFNKSLAVSPITTHIKLSKVAKNISKEKIIKKIITINNFYIKVLKIKPRIGVLWLNPHNNELNNNSEEKKIIIHALKILKRRGISVIGPLSPDTAFLDYKNKKLNILCSFDNFIIQYHSMACLMLNNLIIIYQVLHIIIYTFLS